ncbi:MAG: hypothetical protein ABMA64_20695 [Myxococcota bacterium]
MWVAAALAAPPSIDEPLRTGASAPADAAVVVGVEDYAFVSDVPWAAADADLVYDWLVYTRGVPARAVERLTNPSREQVLAGLDRARAAVGPSGTVWVYWAGHGAASPVDGQRLLLGVDVMPDETVFASRAIAVEEIERRLEGASAVLWLDTCYSGATRTGDPLLPGTRFAVPAWTRAPGASTTVWTAADQGELSSAFDPAGHGLFTYFSVGALRGWADGELTGARDGVVTAGEAQAYVRRALATLGQRRQTPVLEGGDDAAGWSLGAEATPALDGFTGTAPAAGRPDLSAELEALRAQQEARRAEEKAAARARAEALDLAARPVREEAAAAWDTTEEILAHGGPEGEVALRRFLDRYRGAAVTLDGAEVPVTVAEVEVAERALAAYDATVVTARERAARKRTAAGLTVGLGAAASLAVAAGTQALYLRAAPSAGTLDGVYVVNQVASWSALGLGVVGGGLVVSGAF